MALTKKKTDIILFKLVSYSDGVLTHELILNKKQNILGSADKCDLIVNDETISHYHAFINIEDEGIKIIDLNSVNGVFINGSQVHNALLSSGDQLQIGSIPFIVEETLGNTHDFINLDKNIKQSDNSDQTLAQPVLPPRDNLVVIDDEYCDIIFQESTWAPQEQLVAFQPDEQKDYIEFTIDESDDREKELNIESEKQVVDKNAQSLEVTLVVAGHIINIDYLPLKNTTYYLSSKSKSKNTIYYPGIDHTDRVKFLKIKKSNIYIETIENNDLYKVEKNQFIRDLESKEIQPNTKYCLHKDALQLNFKLTDHPPTLKGAPFLSLDQDFKKQLLKSFSLFALFFISLLFVDITETPPPKKLAIIYRQAIKAPITKEKSSSNPDKNNVDTGVKKTEQEKKPTKMAAKKKSSTKPKKTKKVNKPKQKVAKSSPKKATKKKQAPIKTYEFKMNTKLNSLVKNTNTSDLSVNNANDGAQSPTSNNLMASNTSADTKSDSFENSTEVGTLGKDFSGQYDSSTGAKGLSSKSGVDTAYVAPKTVVLGSMDPELLRKILREYLPQFRHCYQKELERNSRAKGIINLNFRIMGNGSVQNIVVSSPKSKFGNKGKGCMANVLKLIKFPKPKGGGVVDIRQPLNFSSSQEKY